MTSTQKWVIWSLVAIVIALAIFYFVKMWRKKQQEDQEAEAVKSGMIEGVLSSFDAMGGNTGFNPQT